MPKMVSLDGRGSYSSIRVMVPLPLPASGPTLLTLLCLGLQSIDLLIPDPQLSNQKNKLRVAYDKVYFLK